MISPLEALENYRYTYFGFMSHPTDKNPWQATPMMAVSNNLTQWEEVTGFDQLEGLRDGFLKKIGDYYYIIGTGGFYKTNDFISFTKLKGLDKGNYKNLWAPEIFQANDGSYHIVYCAGDEFKYDIFIANFDPEKDEITVQNQPVSFYVDDFDNSWRIDPDITVIHGVYYLTLAGNYVFSSNDYNGPYQRFPVNFAPTPQRFGSHESLIDGWVEGPNMFVDGDAVRLFADQTDGNGLVFRSATVDDMFDWTGMEKTHCSFKMRHGSIIVNDSINASVDTEVDDAPKIDDKLTIKGLHDKHEVALTCFMKNSFQWQYENNQTNQIQFVAYDDGSPSFSCIAIESIIVFNNDLFIIKNIEEDDNGSELYTVTAMQYVNSEIGRVRQRNVRNGTLTYTVDAVLDYFLNDKKANPFGFTYHVFGDFDKQQIENLGACSGKDMISKIIETWPGTIVYPKGMTINVYAPGSFKKNYGRRMVYKYHSTDMKLTEDSTNIVNQVLAIGATKDDNDNQADNQNGGSSNSGTDSTTNNNNGGGNAGGNTGGNTGNQQPTQKPQQPGVTPGASLASAEAFAKSPINSDFGVNKDAMLRDFAARDHRVHAWGVDVNRLYDTVKGQGISPEWFFAYDLTEQDPMAWSWLNHFANHLADPYQDAIRVCNWIKQWAYSDGFTPASGFGAWTSPQMRAQWNAEFHKGTIGRLYLQGTAAAVMELAHENPGRYGRPMAWCVSMIKGWGGRANG